MRATRCVLGAVVLCLPICGGCALFVVGAAAGAGAAGAAYVAGDLEAHVNAGPKEIVRASEGALRALDIILISSSASALDGRVVGRTGRDTRVDVSVKLQESGACKVSIRVGVFGDEPMSRRIYDEIRKRLGGGV